MLSLGIFERPAPNDETRAMACERPGGGGCVGFEAFEVMHVDTNDPISLWHWFSLSLYARIASAGTNTSTMSYSSPFSVQSNDT